MSSPLNNFNHFVFDAYGTLFDVHSAVARLKDKIGAKAEELSALWRTKQLEYTWVRSLAGQYQDFQSLTEQSLDFAMRTLRIQDAALREELLKAYESLSAYSEVREVLQELKKHGKHISVFSNGTPQMLEKATAAASIQDLIDDIISVDILRTYKTAPEAYALCCDTLQCEAGEICFQSSNRWDIAGGKSFGFHCIWINRNKIADEYADLPPDLIADDLRVLTHAA